MTLLVGAMGGLALAAVAAARTTQSSFSDDVATSHVPQLSVLDGVFNPPMGLDPAYSAPPLRTAERLPHVEREASTAELNLGTLPGRLAGRIRTAQLLRPRRARARLGRRSEAQGARSTRPKAWRLSM